MNIRNVISQDPDSLLPPFGWHFYAYLGCLWAIVHFSCSPPAPASPTGDSVDSLTNPILADTGTLFDLDHSLDGKLLRAHPIEEVYEKAPLEMLPFPVITGDLLQGLENQLRLLKTLRQRRFQKLGNVEIDIEELEKVVHLLREWQYTHPIFMRDQLEAYQIRGEDGRGNVRFTGYFTPVLEGSTERNGPYQYPIYRYPKNWIGPLPTRKEIEGPKKALTGRDLEIGYTDDRVDLYYMQVQGSGYIRFRDGHTRYLGFAGTNRQPYRSIGKFLIEQEWFGKNSVSVDDIKTVISERPELADSILFINPSYTFFHPKGTQPMGSGSVPLTPGFSIAVDRDFIPLGACLLAAVPVRNSRNQFSHHEYKILLAQDVGGAIRGPGHIDYYCGVGKEAKKEAALFHHYGQLWLLLPKPRT